MAEQGQRNANASISKATMTQPSQATQHPLSCTHCRQRKIKCDKVHPCAPCQRSNLQCVFPERVRHPKKKRDGSKASNDELMRRLGRMEELIEKMKVEGKDANANKVRDDRRVSSSRSPPVRQEYLESPKLQDISPDVRGDGTAGFMGSAFFLSLTNEVEGLKETMDVVTDEEDTLESSQTPSDTHSSNTSFLFGSSPVPSQELRLLHPTPYNMSVLCNIYATNCDPMFKVLHIPSLRTFVSNASANPQEIPSGNFVEALLFAMYYAAITSLTEEECSQSFQDSREHLLSRYRQGTETALANANMLNTTEMGTLQALVVFLGSVRSNDDSQYVWTMTSVAVRLGHSFGLHREESKANLSPFQREMRRRLWWEIMHLDIRCCEDRGSDPMILDHTFNTKRPININDSDMDPESMEPIIERQEFTDMTKIYASHFTWDTAIRVSYSPPVKESEEDLPPQLSFEEKALLINQLERRMESHILAYCDPAIPLAWVTSVVTRLIMARLRLSLYHPTIPDARSASHRLVSRESVLKFAVQNLEYSHLLDTEPIAAKWRWYFNTHVQWHALAATLAELCVRNSGPLVDRAWKIVDVVFDDWAARIAGSKNGSLWRPIKKLMSKAQAKRNELKTQPSSAVCQQPLPQFGSFSPLQDLNVSNVPYHPDSVIGLSQKYNLDQGAPSEILSSLSATEPEGTINWAEWDEFMQDFEMADAGSVDLNVMQQDAAQFTPWW